MKDLDLSIVIATWNRVEHTRQCLASLTGVELNLEIIVVDNGSTDNTVQMIADEFPGVFILRNERNEGVTAAWRKGLSATSASFVCVSNNDIIFEKGCLEKLVLHLRQSEWIGATSPETIMDPNDPVPFFMESSRVQHGILNEPNAASFRIGLAGWCFVFRKKDFKEYFDRKLYLWYQDKDFLYTILFKRRGLPPFRWPVPGKVPVVVSGAVVRHIYHASHGQLNNDWVRTRTQKDKELFNRKWSGTKGNSYIQDVPWSKKIRGNSLDWSIIAQEPSANTNDLSNPMVSIVIPCYNRPSLLTETLHSILDQHYAPLEIILVDDASTEPLQPVICNALKDFPGAWKLVRIKDNSGPGEAKRIGQSLAKGKYIQFLDSDDLLHPLKIQEQVELMEENPSLVMTYSVTSYWNPSDPENHLRVRGRSDQDFDRILMELFTRMIWSTSSCLWRRSMIKPEFWKPLYGAEDFVFDVLVGLSNLPIAKTPGDAPRVYYRVHSEGISNSIASDWIYQQEILKAYDYIVEEIRQCEKLPVYRHHLSKLYYGKIMTFLRFRRYWEVQHCFNQIKELSSNFDIEIRLTEFINRISRTQYGFSGLRKWLWLKKIVIKKVHQFVTL